MKNIRYIIITILLYCINKSLLYLSFDYMFLTSFMVGYFNDVLAGILLISFTNLLLKEKAMKQLWKIECFLLLVGCFWEFITPLYHSNSTSDPLDLFAYLLGGAIYWMINLIKTKKSD